jgi:hypothetical protein
MATVTPANRSTDFGAGQLFLADSRLAFAVLNQLRVRSLQRAFGISREQANMLTFVLALTVGHSAAITAGRVVTAPLRLSRTDGVIGGFLVREGAIGVSGPAAAEISPFATLVSIAVLGGVALPTLRRSVRKVREIEHRVRLMRQRQYANARSTWRTPRTSADAAL